MVAAVLLLLTPMLAWPAETGRSRRRGGTGSRNAEDANTFTLGVLGPFSGPSARTGEEFKGSVTMAMDAIDWKIGDYNIEVVWIDSQSDPAKATNAYEQAVVQDGIQAGIINWHSSVSRCVYGNHRKVQVPPFLRIWRYRSRE